MAGTGYHPEGHRWVPITEVVPEDRAVNETYAGCSFCTNCGTVARDTDLIDREWECVDDQ
jgi:hypothetical protein